MLFQSNLMEYDRQILHHILLQPHAIKYSAKNILHDLVVVAITKNLN